MQCFSNVFVRCPWLARGGSAPAEELIQFHWKPEIGQTPQVQYHLYSTGGKQAYFQTTKKAKLLNSDRKRYCPPWNVIRLANLLQKSIASNKSKKCLKKILDWKAAAILWNIMLMAIWWYGEGDDDDVLVEWSPGKLGGVGGLVTPSSKTFLQGHPERVAKVNKLWKSQLL